MSRRMPACMLVFLALLLPLSAEAQYDPTDPATTAYPGLDKPDLNVMTPDQVRTLPISEGAVNAIVDYLENVGPFAHIYEVAALPAVTTEDLIALKKVVRVVPPIGEETEITRLNAIYYRFRQWTRQEGTNEAIVETWMELAKSPINVNTASYDDLVNLQNVSPQDALAIVEARERGGRIQDRRNLRNVPGLSSWGYSNARYFVTYDDDQRDEDFHGAYQFRYVSRPFEADDMDAFVEDLTPDRDGQYVSWYDELGLDHASPEIAHSVRMHWGKDIRAGLTAYHRAGESFRDQATFKGYFGVENRMLGPVNFKRVYVGNYSLAFGQGVILENTDFFAPRRSGFGFDKRYVGVLGDLSRTHEYRLQGVAAEAEWWRIKGIGFVSYASRDAIMNSDGTVNRLIVLQPRLTNSDLTSLGFEPMLGTLYETTWGYNLRFGFSPGTHVGFSHYVSLYDNWFDPQTYSVIERTDKMTQTDAEYVASYGPIGQYRSVMGPEFRFVTGNVSVQGEYGELQSEPGEFRFGDDPFGLVLSAFFQWEDLNLLALFRHYDLDYDNPYNRGFSNYERFKGTIFEDEFYLTNPLYAQLYDHAAQPQAEEGFYLSSRYRFSSELTAIGEFDTWRRLSDMAHYTRLVVRLYYNPVYPVRFTIRQKYQARDEDNSMDVRQYRSLETRVSSEVRLSNFDEVEFLYAFSSTIWPPRPRLSDDPEPTGESPIMGNVTIPSEAIGVTITHNVADELEVRLGGLVYDGFLWNYEDSEFLVLDNRRNFRLWTAITSRPAPHLQVYLKYAIDRGYPDTYVDARLYNENDDGDPDVTQPWESDTDAWRVRQWTHSLRLQMDVSW
jgi:DNA uptake protein ComE-like DNA-binding protein